MGPLRIGRVHVPGLQHAELPQLARGKGVQTIKIHRTPIAPEKVVSTAVVPEDGTLVVVAGKRYTNLKPSDLESYIGKRAQRGLKLPRGFQSVTLIRALTDREPKTPELVM